MSRIILLDTGPLGLITNPKLSPEVIACNTWLDNLTANGVRIGLPEIVDYELRRELLRAGKLTGLRRLNFFLHTLEYLPLTTNTMQLAAEFWAQIRQAGLPTASDAALDADVILAAQAALLQTLGDDVIIATTNVRHLERLVP
jgi:predicted nucleic acid-binding protein